MEKKLLHAIKYGTPADVERVFEKIYYTYGRLVGYVISKYVFCKEDVEELVDDVFVSFSKEMFHVSFRSIKYYLVSSAKNAAVAFLRKQSGAEIVYLEDIWPPPSVADVAYLPFWDAVREMQHYVTPHEMQIVLQHALFGYTFKELGQANGCPPSTVKTEFYRAIKKCKKVKL